MKVFSEDNALQLAESLLKNDKEIKEKLESKIPDLSEYITKDTLKNYAQKTHTHDEYLTEHQDLSSYVLKSEIPNLDGYAKTEDIPTDIATQEYVMSKINEAQLSSGGGIISIPDEYVTETEMAEAISTALGGDVVIDTRTLSSISATKIKTTYDVDDEINLNDVVVTANYSDGSNSTVSNWTSNINDINTFVDGYKKLEISYYHNGITKTTSIPLKVNFSNTADNIQYAYNIARTGKMTNGTAVIKLTSKLLKRSVVNIRMKVKVIVNRNNNSGYTTIGFGGYNVWGANAVGSKLLNPYQIGEFELEINSERTYSNKNLVPNDTTIMSVYNNGNTKVDADFEILDYSISVTQEAPLIVESISATKTNTRYIIGEDVTMDDVVVTALMSDDTTKTITNYETELDVTNLDDYGKTPLSIVYTENEITNTTTVTLRMYRPFLTEAQEFRDITNFELHDELGLGINIGNCMDSKGKSTDSPDDCGYDWYPNQETLWGQPEIIRQNFIDIREKGFNTVRVPITWSYNSGILEDGNRHISKYWLARANEVVQIGLEEGLYIMINMHHEQPFIYTGVSDKLLENVLKNVKDMWTEIAETFKHYNEKLIFEGFNEVDNLEASFTYGEKAALQMNTVNQVFVDTVRATGGNNAKRILAVPTLVHMNNIAALNAYVTPNDTVENKIILAVHGYPLTFSQDLENTLRPLEEYASKYNLPVLITEWGTDRNGGNGGESSAILPYGGEQRPDHASNFMARTINRGIKSYWWDNGSNFTLVIRCNKKIDYGYVQEELDTIIDAMKDGYNNKTAFALPDENLVQYSSFDGLLYERLNSTTGESKYSHWSDVCTDYISVTAGRGIIIEVVKGATAVAEKIAFASIIYLDENKIPIETFTAKYMANYYSATIPDGATYARFQINSPHNNTTQETYTEMFSTGDLAINMVTYSKEEITKVTLPERTVVESLIEKTNQMYEVNAELDTSDVTVKALLSDGTNIYIHDYIIDTSSVDMSSAGEYNIGISYNYGDNEISSTIPVYVGDVLSYIEATKTATTYFVDSELDTSDIVVTAYYSSGETVDVTSSCVIDSSVVDTAMVGDYTITVTYVEGEVTKTCKILITVKEFDVNEYVDVESIRVSSGDLSTAKYTLSEETIAEYPYVVVNNGSPMHAYYSKKPMYVTYKEGYIVYDSTCTLRQVNSGTPNIVSEKQVIGDYCTHSTKLWNINLANYDVYKWIGGIPS